MKNHVITNKKIQLEKTYKGTLICNTYLNAGPNVQASYLNFPLTS